MLLRGKYKNLPEDPDSIPASTWLITTGYNSKFQGVWCSLITSAYTKHAHGTHTYTCRIINNFQIYITIH